jgi:hypothetical protein
MRPPWFTERLLDSFIEDRAVSEDALGDLAEEWREHAQRHGPRAASWWYRKQAARSVLDLFRSGRVPLPTAALLGAALVTGLPLLLFTAWAGSMTSIADWAMAMFGSGGGEGGETLPLTRTAPAIWATRALVTSSACGFIGGSLLALLSRKGGMVQVTLLAALWVPCALALRMFVPETWPDWYGLTLPAAVALGTFAGGVGGVALKRGERLTFS